MGINQVSLPWTKWTNQLCRWKHGYNSPLIFRQTYLEKNKFSVLNEILFITITIWTPLKQTYIFPYHSTCPNTANLSFLRLLSYSPRNNCPNTTKLPVLKLQLVLTMFPTCPWALIFFTCPDFPQVPSRIR